MTHQTDTDLVFLDLCDAAHALNEVRDSPKEVRRAFSRYIELSQRLTSVMRKDYKKLKGKKWEASLFSAWTPATSLLKYLRNQDQHDEQVFITVKDHHYFRLPDDVEVPGFPEREFEVDSHWHMTDQILDRPPVGLEVSLNDPGAPLGSGAILEPYRTESRYVLYPRGSHDRKRIEAAGISDVHAISAETLETLRLYYDFFRQHLGT